MPTSRVMPSNKELERTRSTQTAVGPRRSIQCSTGTSDAKNRRPTVPIMLLLTVALLSLASGATALEVRVSVGACLPGALCYWDLSIGADRRLKIDVYPAVHNSRQFMLSRKEFSDLEALLRREDFFSLPKDLGALLVDGPMASLEVRDGKKSHAVTLHSLPFQLKPIWRSDAGATGRAFRVCEQIRALAKIADILQCPGVPSADREE